MAAVLAPSMALSPSVLAVVLSYKSRDDTLECLASLRTQQYPKLDILVINNDSADGSAEAIRAAYPEFELVALPSNSGWAGGNNVGIRLALERGYDYVCLLNNDTVMGDNTYQSLADAAACLGPCLLHPTIYAYDDGARAQLDPSATAVRQPGTPCGVVEMNYAYGACLMIHNSIFRRVGLLDERFFLQLEETDFFARAQKAGFRSFCCLDARIRHKISRSFGAERTPLKTYYITRNSLLLAEKHNRTWRGFFLASRQIYWSLSGRIGEIGIHVPFPTFLRWLVSRDPFAAAARLGIKDYVLRRFGRIGQGSESALGRCSYRH